MRLVKHIPNLLSGLRIVVTGVIVWLVVSGRYLPAFLVFLLAAVSDIIDGPLARKLGAESRLGSYLDPFADFILVFGTSSGLVMVGIFPLWFLIVEAGMFAQFILTSNRARPVNDPIGKYYGTVVMIGILAVLVVPQGFVPAVVPWIVLGVTIVSLSNRISMLRRLGNVVEEC